AQILEPDADKISQAAADLVENQACHLIQSAGGLERLKKSVRFADTHRVYLRDVFPLDAIMKRVIFQPRAATLVAHQVSPITRPQNPHMHAVAFSLEPAKPATDALIFAVALHDESFLFLRQLAPGLFRRNLFALTKIE